MSQSPAPSKTTLLGSKQLRNLHTLEQLYTLNVNCKTVALPNTNHNKEHLGVTNQSTGKRPRGTENTVPVVEATMTNPGWLHHPIWWAAESGYKLDITSANNSPLDWPNYNLYQNQCSQSLNQVPVSAKFYHITSPPQHASPGISAHQPDVDMNQLSVPEYSNRSVRQAAESWPLRAGRRGHCLQHVLYIAGGGGAQRQLAWRGC